MRLGRGHRILLASGLAAIAVVLAGCSSGLGQHQVFLAGREVLRGPAHTDELVDIVVQFSNLTGNPVRLVSLSLATSLPGVRVIGTSVYDERLAGSAPAVDMGDLPAECPGKFIPHPVSSLVVAPRQYSDWYGVLTIRITRPGRYAIPPVRITYSTAGGQGWQDQLASLTLIVSNPPLPGPRPVPRDQACPPV